VDYQLRLPVSALASPVLSVVITASSVLTVLTVLSVLAIVVVTPSVLPRTILLSVLEVLSPVVVREAEPVMP